MDITPIINILFSVVWYLIALAILAAFFRSPSVKGELGEFRVNLLLKLSLPKDKYHLIKNVTLPAEDGTTQIDHVLVSQYGVFVIETKNMKGWIFGSANQKQWTQKIFKYSSKFQNPIHQNYKHIKVLESCLKIDPSSIFSVIVFIGDSTFKTNMPRNVTSAGGCIKYIKSINTKVLSPKQVNDVISTIESGRLQPGIVTNREHVAHVKKTINAKKTDNTCPRCGAAMVKRESKKGVNTGKKFWGCSAFPKCRAIAKIT